MTYHVLVMFTDGKNVLFVKDKSIGLPDSSISYPLEWKKKDSRTTSIKLLWIVSYGLIDLQDNSSYTFRANELFGQDMYKAVEIKVSSEMYNTIVKSLQSITKYMKYKKYETRQFESVNLETIESQKNISASGLHCVRSFINK